MSIEWKSCFKVGASIFVLYLCIQYWPGIVGGITTMIGAGFPIAVGFAIAYIVNILMSMYERLYFPNSKKKIVVKSRRQVCMVSAFITLVAIVVLVIILVLPQLISCIQVIFAELPGFIEKIVDEVENLGILPEDIIKELDSKNWRERIGQLVQILTSGIGNVVDVLFKTISSVFSGTVTALLSIIFSIYLLMGKDKLRGQFKRLLEHYLDKRLYNKIYYVVSILNDSFHRYIVGQCTEAVIIGVLCAIGMWILRLPYATMVGALIAFTALIPVAGAYIGAIVGAFMILTVSPIKAVVFLIFIVILQQVEGNLIYPRVVGSSLGLPAIWVLAAVTVGGGVMGIAGMLLSVPLTATVYTIIKNDVNKSKKAKVKTEEKRKIRQETMQYNS